jgi:hypothetical protein
VHIEFIVEERSAKAALENIVPMIINQTATFQIHSHRGKTDLLDKLARRLSGYASWLPDDWRIVVLIDADDDECHELKERLAQSARQAGLRPKSPTSRGRFHVLNRIAVEELEAWFFGDIGALVTAFSRVPDTLTSRPRFRDPDRIRGGTWEALERELKRAGYFRTGLPKIHVAREISRFIDPDRSTSRSFQVFRDGLRDMCGQPGPVRR